MAEPARLVDSLSVLRLRARFLPETKLAFPGAAAVPIRGALGFCLPEEIFRPRRDTGPSGLRDAPRPFVLRVRHLDGASFAPGETLEVGLHLFAPELLPMFESALRKLASFGLGRNRAKLEWGGLQSSLEEVSLVRPEPCDSVEVFFLTPTELKSWRGNSAPPFDILAARIRDRISALSSLYGGGAPNLDFRGLAERARSVRTASGELTQVRASRTSWRTGQTHPLSGFTGRVRYEGELAEFVPLLRAACLTGVGRQTVWGHGEIGLALNA